MAYGTELFKCVDCGNLDAIQANPRDGAYRCYRCRYGSWHGFFEERKATSTDACINTPNTSHGEAGEVSLG